MKELEFRGRLGDGAEADVWRAFDPALERHVAVKVFRPSCADNAHVLAQARALARVESRHVVKVYEFAEVEPPEPAGRHPAVLMEAFPGEKLGKRLAGVMFSRGEVRAVGLGLLDGLAAIHRAGIAHGDLHDGNVLVAANGEVRIIDILYRGSLAVLSTASREEKVRKDVRSLLAMLAEVLFHSDLDPEASQRLRRLARDSLDLDVLRSAFDESLAAFEPTPGAGRVLTAPIPDVRVTTGAGSTFGPPQPGRHFLMVTVANHSPVRLYVQSLTLGLPERHFLLPQVDAVYGRPIIAPVLEPGDSWQVPLDAEEIAAAVRGDITLVQSVVVTDKIGREYQANGDDVRAKLREVLDRIEATKTRQSPAEQGPKEPDELQQVLVNMVVDDYLRTGIPVPGLRIRTRMREVGRERIDEALDGCVPAWLQRGNLRPHDQYTPTISGLAGSSSRAFVEPVVAAVLGFLREAVLREDPNIKLTPKALSTLPGMRDVEVPYLAAILDITRLTGGGSASGRPYTDFEYNAPADLEEIMDCQNLDDLVTLRVAASEAGSR